MLVAPLILVGTAAYAQDDPTTGGGTGGGSTPSDPQGPPPPDHEQITKQAQEKSALASEYYDVHTKGKDDKQFQQMVKDYRKKYGKDGWNPGQAPRSGDATASATDRTLGMRAFGQSNGSYCGPASGGMMLEYRAIASSHYDGQPRSQITLANNNHMKTDYWGKTRWDLELWRIGVNRFEFGTDAGYYVQTPTPSASQFISYLVYDIDNSRPFGLSTVEYAGGAHYNGHPDRLIGHWTTTYGYGASGSNVLIADPSFSIYGGSTLAQFRTDSAAFTNTYLNTNGIAW